MNAKYVTIESSASERAWLTSWCTLRPNHNAGRSNDGSWRAWWRKPLESRNKDVYEGCTTVADHSATFKGLKTRWHERETTEGDNQRNQTNGTEFLIECFSEYFWYLGESSRNSHLDITAFAKRWKFELDWTEEKSDLRKNQFFFKKFVSRPHFLQNWDKLLAWQTCNRALKTTVLW